MKMMDIEKDKKLLNILTEHSTQENNYLEEIRKLKQNTLQNDIIIPVIGIQGVGKSTLLNAIIGEEILPNEADETTCVPVEIRYAQNDSTEVYFTDGTVNKKLRTKEDLSVYVDNNNNPGNEKNVEKIVVFRHYPILQSGLVFVDLPGVGSLTHSNEKTTRDYLQKMCVAMFVIPSVLKGADAKLIKLIWGAVSSVFFVENIWNDETEEEVVIGLDFNNKAIKQLATELKLKNIPEIINLNAYKAALGSFKKDEKLIIDSGLPKLLAVLGKFQSNYKVFLAKGFADKVQRYIELVAESINDKIQNAQLTTDGLEKKLKVETEAFTNNISKVENVCQDIKTYLENKRNAIKIFAETVAGETGDRLKIDVYSRIDAGLVDGTELQTAFEDLQNVRAGEVFEKIKDEFELIQQDLQEKLKEMEEIISEESWNPDSVVFHKAESLKWEKGLNYGFKIGGAVAAFFAADAAAALFTSALVAGPVGIAVAGLVYAVFSFVGNEIKETKMNQRKRQTKEQIKPYIAKFKNIIIEAVISQFDNLEDTVNNNLEEYIKDRKEFSDKKKASIDTIKSEAEKNKTRIGDLKAEYNYLQEWKEKHYEQ